MYSNTKFDNNTKTKALGLKKKMYLFDFIVSLLFMKNIIYKIKSLTETLETKNLCLIDAASVIKAIIRSLQVISLDSDSINNLINSAISFTKNLGFDVKSDFNLHHRKRKPPNRLDSCPTTQNVFNLHTFYRK